MDPASLALGAVGLTGLFDACLKLYEHVCNAKRYPEDCKRQVLFLQLERSRFKGIRDELLRAVGGSEEPAAVDGDEILFQTSLQPSPTPSPASPGVWRHEYLGRLLSTVRGVLTEAEAIVEKYQKTDSKRKLRTFISSRLHTHQLSWIADDRNRLKELVETLRQLNSYLENLLPAPSRQRLQLAFEATVVLSADAGRLRDIQSESVTGYESLNHSATVRLAKLSMESKASNSQQELQDSRMDHRCLRLRKPIANGYNVYSSAIYETGPPGHLHRQSVLIERRQAFTTVDSLGEAGKRLNSLVVTLQSMQASANQPPQNQTNSTAFGVPRCLGWIAPEGSNLDVIDLVYEYPMPTLQPPVSLHTLLQTLLSTNRPSLGARFNLALCLAQSYGRFISVGYLHKGFHSHNVLFFNDTLTPYIVGYAESRPEIAPMYSSPLSDVIPDRELYIPWETILEIPEPDPSKRTRWSAAADIYGLGVMLVEIGRWTCTSQEWRTASLYDFHQKVLPGLVDELGYHMGDIYRDVARACLRVGDFEFTTEIGVWQNYSDKILKPLELCRA